jgi:hypothetical protein
MPNTAMLTQVNVMFAPPQLDELDPEVFRPGASTANAVGALGLADVDYVGAYLAAMPASVIDTMLSAIYNALTSTPRATVQLGWTEGSRYGAQVSEVPPTANHPRGSVTIILTGPLTP